MAGSESIDEQKSFHRPEFLHHLSILVTLFVVFVAQAALPDTTYGTAIKVSLQAVALVLTIRLGTLRRVVAVIGYGVAGLGVMIALVGWIAGTQAEVLIIVDLVLVASAPVAIFRSVLRHASISMATVIGAVSIFLLIGLFFASLHHVIYQFDGDAYTVASGALEASTFQYFSFITLTTVGFGDVLAVTNFTRMLVAMEAVVGQVFLVTVVALVVGNLGRTRARRGD
jgi:hypothetical protein